MKFCCVSITTSQLITTFKFLLRYVSKVHHLKNLHKWCIVMVQHPSIFLPYWYNDELFNGSYIFFCHLMYWILLNVAEPDYCIRRCSTNPVADFNVERSMTHSRHLLSIRRNIGWSTNVDLCIIILSFWQPNSYFGMIHWSFTVMKVQVPSSFTVLQVTKQARWKH